MPRYFFHFEGQQPHTDTTGEMLLDDEAAWREAVRLSRDVEHALRPRRQLDTQRVRRDRAGVRAGDGDAAVSVRRAVSLPILQAPLWNSPRLQRVCFS